MIKTNDDLQLPKLAIIYAYIITFGSIFGLICFIFLYFTDIGYYIAKINISPILLALSMLIFSILGLLTGGGLLFRKKFGWILDQFLLIYILIWSIYNLVIIPFLLVYTIDFPMINLVFFFLILICCGLIILYFNQNKIIMYFGLEREDANRIYLFSFLTCILVLFLSNLL